MPLTRRDSTGFTIIEMSIAMTVLAVVLAVFATTVRLLASSTSRAYALADVTTQGRSAVDALGRQLGFASAVNTPVQVGQNWYLEFESDDVKSGNDPVCTQWRYQPASRLLDYRTWSTVTLVPTSWVPIVRSMVNDPATQPPFTVYGSDSGFAIVRVAVDLRLAGTSGVLRQSQAQFALRNSQDAPLPGPSTVCTQLGRP